MKAFTAFLLFSVFCALLFSHGQCKEDDGMLPFVLGLCSCQYLCVRLAYSGLRDVRYPCVKRCLGLDVAFACLYVKFHRLVTFSLALDLTI